MNLAIKEKKTKVTKPRCDLCNVCPANMEKHMQSKSHLKKAGHKRDGDNVKILIKEILSYREDLPSIDELIEDCDRTDSHDVFVTGALIEFLQTLQCQQESKFQITDESIEMPPDEFRELDATDDEI